MTRTSGTVVTTTAVPMQGYEEALIVAGGCSSRLYDLPHPYQRRLPLEDQEPLCHGDPVWARACGQVSYYLQDLQASASRCRAWLSEWESAPEPELSPPFACRDRDFVAAVRSAYLSFFLASIKACAKGELTRPIVLRGQASLGGKIDLRSEGWLVWCKSSQPDEDHVETFDVFLACRPALDARTFLEDVYDLGHRDLQAATDKVFDTIDRLLCAGRLEACDQILASVDVARLPTALLRSFLTITAAAKERLPARQELFQKIEREMTHRRGAEVTRRLLGNLA